MWKNISHILKFKAIFYFIIWRNLYFVFSLKELKIIRINHPVRLLRYKNSIRERITRVGISYNLDKINFSQFNNQNLNILDCGANIGEVAMYLNSIKVNYKYYCFEPLDIAYRCIKFNHPNANLFKLGLSNNEENKTFYIKNDTNDNSLIKFNDFDYTSEIECKKLTNILEIESLDFIHLFKIDGEGYEPEILKGSEKFFRKIYYISVDCGAERNLEKTDISVKKILEKEFVLLFHNKKRDTLLFGNKNLINNIN